MPTAIDPHGVVHNARVDAGLVSLQCGTRLKNEDIRMHKASPVTCFACIAEAPRPSSVYVVCDHCGWWWREDGEDLVFVAVSPPNDPKIESFTVMKRGTLPTCERCP
jgi:hypothetical protein